MLGLVLNLANVDDYKIVLMERFRPIFVSNLASGSISNLLFFGFKNMLQSFRSKGSLVVVKSDVISVKVDQDTFRFMRAAHSLVHRGGRESKGRRRKPINGKVVPATAHLNSNLERTSMDMS